MIFALPPDYGIKTVEVYRAKGTHGRLLERKYSLLEGKTIAIDPIPLNEDKEKIV